MTDAGSTSATPGPSDELDAARNPPASGRLEVDLDDPDDPKQLRTALNAAEARFYNTVERIADGVVILDDEDTIRYANPAARELFGRPPGELTGSVFGHPVTAGESTEIDLVRRDGARSVAELRVAATEWEGEEARLVSLRDITDRKRAEERERELIREQTARAQAEQTARRNEILARASQALGSTLQLDKLLGNLAYMVAEEIGDLCLIDIDDNFGPMRRLVGARRDFPRKALLKDLEVERLPRPGIESLEGRVFRTGESELVAEVTEEWLDEAAQNADEVHFLEVLDPISLMMVTLYAGALRWGVVTVVSCDPERHFDQDDLSLLEEMVRRGAIAVENARLFRLARDASRAKSDFLAIVSHELRTPLSAIEGYAGLLEEGVAGDLNQKQKEYLVSINRSAAHLLRLIEQIITFARLEGDHEKVEPEDLDVPQLLDEVASLARPLAERKSLEFHMRVVPAEDTPHLEADGKKLFQILINLVTNAIKYTDDGEVRLEAELSDDEAVFRVRDTGCGVPSDKLEEIFEPFRQAERPQTRRSDGAGIGLSVVKRLTHLLRGEVGVESEVDRGSTFSVRFPRRFEEDEASA